MATRIFFRTIMCAHVSIDSGVRFDLGTGAGAKFWTRLCRAHMLTHNNATSRLPYQIALGQVDDYARGSKPKLYARALVRKMGSHCFDVVENVGALKITQ